MDYTPDLSAFRGILTSLNNVHPFSKLSSRGGNEEKLDYVIASLTKFLKEKKYIIDSGIVDQKESHMKKFALFIVLNTDLAALGDMVDNEHIDSVVWAIPTIPKFLMTYMLLKLHMAKFVYDIISFSCPELSTELAAAILENIKWLHPEDSLAVQLVVLSGLYHLTCRLHFFKFENDILTNIMTSTFNSIQKGLNYFTAPPNAEKLLRLKKDAEYHYIGERLSIMFTLLKNCMKIYSSAEKFYSKGFDRIYQLTYKSNRYNENDLDFEMSNSPNKLIKESLEKYLIAMLDKCMELVMDISVDIFCAWSEFRKNGKEMQHVIGDQSYKLNQLLLSTKCFSEHPLVGMLHQISRKPEAVRDLINETDTDIIVRHINNNDADKHEWVQALIYKDGLLNHLLLVQQLKLNIDIILQDDAENLYEKCYDYLSQSIDSPSDIKILAVLSFHKCSTVVKHKILREHFKDNFTNQLETTDFRNMMTEIFNKIINTQDADLSDILCVFVQNPQIVSEKIVSVATDSTEQSDNMVKAMELLDNYTKHTYREQTDADSCLYRIIKDFFFKLETVKKQRNFISFICGIKEIGCLTEQDLLHSIIMPNLHTAMVDGNMRAMNIACKMLFDAISLNKLMECKTPMLVMLAQVLDATRWRVDTFYVDRLDTLQTVLMLQNTLISFYNDDVPEDEASWLKEKLRNIGPLNQFYYKALWGRTGNFIEEVAGFDTDEKTDKLILWLSQVLCITTVQEWYLIWSSMDYLSEEQRLEIISTVVHVLIASERSAPNGTSWDCMLHVFENYVSLLRYKYLTHIQEPYEEVKFAIDKIAYVVNTVEEENVESIRTVLMPLVAYLLENGNNYNINTREFLRSKLKFKDIMSNGDS